MLENRKDMMGLIIEGLSLRNTKSGGYDKTQIFYDPIENKKEIRIDFVKNRKGEIYINGMDKRSKCGFYVFGEKQYLKGVWDEFKKVVNDSTKFPDFITDHVRTLKSNKNVKVRLYDWEYESYTDLDDNEVGDEKWLGAKNGVNEGKLPTWAVTGRSPDDMRPKTVIVKAKDKETAIKKGLEKIGTTEFMDCRLRST